ncbi:MAG: amidohydrolase family protein [Chloroflexota bacterium]|nr:MAG: amidohydrolase family protein [Chloroflexota bacterium]
MIERLPGLIDPHVHLREPGATHKEDWDSGTKAGLAGGFTILLAMPNTDPPITSKKSFDMALAAAENKSRLDYAQFFGASRDNSRSLGKIATRAAGLKMYLDQTYGPLCLDDMTVWREHFLHWPGYLPITVHAERRTLAAVLLMSILYDKHVHICHVARREEILLIKIAKEKGVKVTCEVSPHHLFLTEKDISPESPGRGEVRPRLGNSKDRDALWENLEVVDCFATDHAPHTLEEKDSKDPPPGFPGLETALFLFLTAVAQGKLTLDDVVLRMYTNPKKIYKLPNQYNTWLEVDPQPTWEIQGANTFTRCGWTPFEGWKVHGRLKKVTLRGKVAYDDGKVIAKPGSGVNIRKKGIILDKNLKNW